MKKTKLFEMLAVTVIVFIMAACGGGSSTPGSNNDTNDIFDTSDTPDSPALIVNGEYVTFGEWPQTVKSSSVTINESETRQAGAYTYYKGSDGSWYAKCLENAFYPDSLYSNGNVANKLEAYCERYFKVEPIKWRVLTHNYNGTGKALLLSNSVLINCAFYDEIHRVRRGLEEDTQYAKENHYIVENDYMYSRVRAYLNGLRYYINEDILFDHDDKNKLEDDEFVDIGFLQTAFTQEEQEYIAVTSIVNNAENANPNDNPVRINEGNNQFASDVTLQDKIFLLSLKEATNTDFGFAGGDSYFSYSQILFPTDFAIANGTMADTKTDDDEYNTNTGSEWWLRSPDEEITYGISTVADNGFAPMISYSEYSYIGVAPALCIDLSYCKPAEGGNPGKGNGSSSDSSENGIPLDLRILDFRGTSYEECGTERINGKDYKLVKFGDFPQTEKLPFVIINEKIQAKMGDYTYYLGDDSAWYAKIGYYYYKVEPIIWRILTEDYDHDQDSATAGKKLLLAKQILMNRSYYDFNNVNRTVNGNTIYPNNYQYSRIRAYLNGNNYPVKTPAENAYQSITEIEWNYDEEIDCAEFKNKGFLNTAFTSLLREQIAVTEVDNSIGSTVSHIADDDMPSPDLKYICPNTYDKVFLLSEWEVTNPDYGFERAKNGIGPFDDDPKTSIRALRPTAFACANGLDLNRSNLASYWLLRSPVGKGDSNDWGGSICHVHPTGYNWNNGGVSSFSELFEIYAGIVPAICLE